LVEVAAGMQIKDTQVLLVVRAAAVVVAEVAPQAG
jgi:hypothetical protein